VVLPVSQPAKNAAVPMAKAAERNLMVGFIATTPVSGRGIEQKPPTGATATVLDGEGDLMFKHPGRVTGNEACGPLPQWRFHRQDARTIRFEFNGTDRGHAVCCAKGAVCNRTSSGLGRFLAVPDWRGWVCRAGRARAL
jgi:hypothetical protein